MSELTTLTIAAARGAMRAGELTAAELTEACLAAIEAARPLNAFVHETPEIARAQAEAADRRRGRRRAALERHPARDQGPVLHQGRAVAGREPASSKASGRNTNRPSPGSCSRPAR